MEERNSDRTKSPLPLSVVVSLLLYETPLEMAIKALSSLIVQEGFVLGKTLQIIVGDNSSSPVVFTALREHFKAYPISFVFHERNLGFCGGHNYAAARFLEGDCTYFLTYNPDLFSPPSTLQRAIVSLHDAPQYHAATVRLMRAHEDLSPCIPEIVDSVGIVMTPDLRHFDRGGGSLVTEDLTSAREVFGATGAFLLLKREAVQGLLVKGEKHERDLYRVYPQLEKEAEKRVPLFDEAFFAYREDADLAWRMQIRGMRVLVCGDIVAYHVRRVTPERRSSLPAIINALGVKNRFLLQINNYSLCSIEVLLRGILLRNILVLVGVLLIERRSISALVQCWTLFARARERRTILFATRKREGSEIELWFNNR